MKIIPVIRTLIAGVCAALSVMSLAAAGSLKVYADGTGKGLGPGVGKALAEQGFKPRPTRQATNRATASRHEWSALRHCERKTHTVTAGV